MDNMPHTFFFASHFERKQIRMEPKITDAPFIYFIKSFIKRYIDDDIGALASEASYCFILGLVPFLIFLVNCILFFAAPQLDTIMHFLQYLPEQFAASMEANVARIVEGRSSLWLFIGLAGAVWTASQGASVLVRGMDQIFFEDRNIQSWFKVSAKACVFTVLLVFAMIFSLLLIVFANAVMFFIQEYIFQFPDIFWLIWKPARYGIPFVVMSLSLAAFYRYAPSRYITKWTRIVMASFAVTVILLLVTAGYGYYILNVSRMGMTYGSLIGLIFLFLWLHLAVQVILAGGAMIMAWGDMRERKEKKRIPV